ncbi:MAG: nitroreductase family protein, partial [Anaerolineae bacterium]|nr:nitroreductase family protein [Anaerolineae bacterium]
MERPKLAKYNFEDQKSIPYDGRFMQPGTLVEKPNPHMPLIDAVNTRRTTRSYRDEPVDMDTFEWLMMNSMNAPTACNEQQWKAIYIDDHDILMDLYERGSASFLQHTKQAFLLCYNKESDNLEWDDHIQSGAAFITTFQLLAHSVGVGSCWVGHLPNKREIRRIFKIHRYYEPIALVSFGYYRSKVTMLPRKHDTSHVIMHNRFTSEGFVFGDRRKTFFRTIARIGYYLLPSFVRRKLKPFLKRFE